MENIPNNTSQDEDLLSKKSIRIFTSSKTIDVILGFLGCILIGSSPILFTGWNDSGALFIIAGFIIIGALIFAKVSGFKYLFYGILSFVSVVGIVFGGCVFILLSIGI